MSKHRKHRRGRRRGRHHGRKHVPRWYADDLDDDDDELEPSVPVAGDEVDYRTAFQRLAALHPGFVSRVLEDAKPKKRIKKEAVQERTGEGGRWQFLSANSGDMRVVSELD